MGRFNPFETELPCVVGHLLISGTLIIIIDILSIFFRILAQNVWVTFKCVVHCLILKIVAAVYNNIMYLLTHKICSYTIF